MLYIHGMGHFHPSNILDNAFFESLNIETNEKWILDRVGIHERRTVLNLDYIRNTYNKDRRLSDQNVDCKIVAGVGKAVEMALTRSNLSLSDIGIVLASSCSSDFLLPATASLVANELGLTDIPCLDVNSACSSFASHIHFAGMMAKEQSPDYILLVQVENWTKSVDYSDRRTAVLVGDALTVAVVSKKHRSPFHVVATELTSDPLNWQKVQTPCLGHFYQEGPAVQKFAIKKTIATFKKLELTMGYDLSQHYFIGHQANLTMLKSVCDKLNISEQHHLYNIDGYGNCGGAGAPSVLSENWSQFSSGDELTIVVVGAGLTWGGMHLVIT